MRFSPGRCLRFYAALSLLAGTGAVVAAAEGDARVQQRLHEEVQSVLVRMIQSGELPAQTAEGLSLQAPAGRQAAFGAYFDVRHRDGSDADGVVVIGVTPGGSAASLGLLAGDRVVAVLAPSGRTRAERGRARARSLARELVHGDDGSVTVGGLDRSE